MRRVQLARVFPDSKSFVDLRLVRSENETLADFDELLRDTGGAPSRARLADFVRVHFADGDELEPWTPPDFDPDPPLLARVRDPRLREFARDLVGIWPRLGRRVKPVVAAHPERYSLLSVPHGFVVPGGRFREMYYWDSYWTVRGLLASGMRDAARGVLDNLLHLVGRFGYVPNGCRQYYLGRSQPPMLAAAVAAYVNVTDDVAWLAGAAPLVERELQYWLDNRRVSVRVRGTTYELLRYRASSEPGGPRPESYYEDYEVASELPDDASRENFYMEIKSAAESGWDFSSRWFASEDGNLTDVRASRVVPVDLNAMFAGALRLAGEFRSRLKDKRAALKWWSLARYWRGAVDAVLWHPADGVWYDYDIAVQAPRRGFYPSCAAPLWAGAVEEDRAPEYAARLLAYLTSSGALHFPGGVPASLQQTGEQWDFPNAWPPLQSVLIGALRASGNKSAHEEAARLAGVWVRANYAGYRRWRKMFEKYSATEPGHQGGGGEYDVQDGFAWTNGVALHLLELYGDSMTLHDDIPQPPAVTQLR